MGESHKLVIRLERNQAESCSFNLSSSKLRKKDRLLAEFVGLKFLY